MNEFSIGVKKWGKGERRRITDHTAEVEVAHEHEPS
jgi:hypothetical protein